MIVGVWVLGLIVVLGLWQQVDAACGDGTAANDPMTNCAPVPVTEQQPEP